MQKPVVFYVFQTRRVLYIIFCFVSLKDGSSTEMVLMTI